jgi:hypothetical protein
MDGATIECAMEDESSDEGESSRVNRLPNRPRSGSAVVGDALFDSGGSSEGSMPASSYETNQQPQTLSCNIVLLQKENRRQTLDLEMTEADGSQSRMTLGLEARESRVLWESLPRTKRDRAMTNEISNLITMS